MIIVRVFFGVQLTDTSFGPSVVVNFSIAYLNLVAIGLPSWDHAIGEDSPSGSKVMALFKSSIHNHILVATEALSMKLNVINSLAIAIRYSGSFKTNAVFSNFRFEVKLLMVDLIITWEVVLYLNSVKQNRKFVACLCNISSWGTIKLQTECTSQGSITGLAMLMGCLDPEAGG